jgi:ubiquinone/menaquinone biosynthesis C-methylase UbiE
MGVSNNEDAKKYETSNPLARLLLKNFFSSVDSLLHQIDFDNICEVGCGCGYVTEFIKQQFPQTPISAIDINEEKIAVAKTRVDGVAFTVGTIYDIALPDNSFDLVISTEVLEHLDNPQSALKELNRISKKHIIVSAPNEPLWRIANMARFKYWGTLGNTPGHINHWSKNSLCSLANEICDVRTVQTPFPFTVLLLCPSKTQF